jgi:hypothetical protein
MSFPCLLYWGSRDRQMAKNLRRTRELLSGDCIDFVEFPGLDHGSFNEGVVAEVVIPTFVDWVGGRLGRAW